MRDDFSKKVRDTIIKRAAYICSNPSCRKMTIAPSNVDENATQFIGVCAHISAAQVNGPRYRKELTTEMRRNVKNGLFLCAGCAMLIDKNNGMDYPEEMLLVWKQEHESWIQDNLNKSIPLKSSVIRKTSIASAVMAKTIHVHAAETKSRSKKSDKLDHDKTLFDKIMEFISEENFRLLISTLKGNESIRIDEIGLLHNLEEFLKLSSSSFIDESIEGKKQRLLKSIKKLNNFIHQHFDAYPYRQDENNFQVCLSPATNSDRAGKMDMELVSQHFKLHEKMVKVLDRLKDAYSRFRKEVKVILAI